MSYINRVKNPLPEVFVYATPDLQRLTVDAQHELIALALNYNSALKVVFDTSVGSSVASSTTTDRTNDYMLCLRVTSDSIRNLVSLPRQPKSFRDFIATMNPNYQLVGRLAHELRFWLDTPYHISLSGIHDQDGHLLIGFKQYRGSETINEAQRFNYSGLEQNRVFGDSLLPEIEAIRAMDDLLNHISYDVLASLLCGEHPLCEEFNSSVYNDRATEFTSRVLSTCASDERMLSGFLFLLSKRYSLVKQVSGSWMLVNKAGVSITKEQLDYHLSILEM